MTSQDKPPYSPISKEDSESLSLGKITISDEVIAAIASQAARKVEGVRVVGSTFRLTEILGGKEGSRKGVTVKTDEASGHVEIDVDVNVVYGINIYEAASNLQRLIKDEVESLTGSMIVDRVNPRVKQMEMPEPEEESGVVRPDQAMAAGLADPSESRSAK